MKMERLNSGTSRYDEGTGLFTNDKGIEEGYLARNGYVYTSLDGKLVLAHRLVFFLENGEWPSQDVDHINGSRHDNRRENLRLCTRSQNLMNRVAEGLTQHPNGRYRAKLKVNGKMIHIGYFEDKYEGLKAVAEAKQKYFGEFARV